MYSIQHVVIKFAIDLRQVGSFLWVFRFPPPIKMTATIDTTEILLKVALSTKVSLNVETSIGHHFCKQYAYTDLEDVYCVCPAKVLRSTCNVVFHWNTNTYTSDGCNLSNVRSLWNSSVLFPLVYQIRELIEPRNPRKSVFLVTRI